MTQTDGFLTLQNEYMRIEICDPAADDAHFSSRYSHTGYISQIYAPGGEGLLGMPTEDFRPLSGEGFPDEFEMPVGYDEAAVGGEFLKIGAGRERRRSKAPYTNRDGHEIVRRAEISVSREKGALTFFAADSLGDYAYRYRKRISAEGGKLIVSHFLENAGKRSWETLWYSHAFLPHGGAEDVYACLPSGYVPLRNTEDVIPEGDGRRTKWKIPAFAAAREKGVCPNWRAEGENFQALEIGGRRIYEAKGNYPFGELQIFVNRRIASAEPKLHIRLGEGQTREWTTEYLFGKSGRENNVE